jgi:predicted DNA-binding transcriptional regulator AlpA
MCKLDEVNKLSINPERTYTKTAYHKKYGISRPTIDKMIEEKKLKSIKIKGAIIIVD